MLELALVELARLSELDVSLVVELSVELLLCRLTWYDTVMVAMEVMGTVKVMVIALQTELTLPLRLWFEMRSRCW